MLSAIMLLGVMSVATFAEDIPNPWELEDWGQMSWTLYISDHEPAIDGKVEEGEYALAFEGLDVATDPEDDRVFVVDFPNIEVDMYMSYDGDFYYVAFVVKDPDIILENAKRGEGVNLGLSADKEKFAKDDRLAISVKAGATSHKLADQVCSVIEGDTITYEIAIDKYTIIDQYGLDELEMLYILCNVSDETPENATNDALYNDIFFGFMTKDLVNVLPAHTKGNQRYRYPHIIYIVNEEAPAPETEAPETEASATEAPVTEAPAGETEAPATDAPVTEAPVAEGGCGASVAAMGVALVAILGTCTAFVSKKR